MQPDIHTDNTKIMNNTYKSLETSFTSQNLDPNNEEKHLIITSPSNTYKH